VSKNAGESSEVPRTDRTPAPDTPSDAPGREVARSGPAAELRTYTQGAATLWLSQSPTFSLWRGEVAAPDRLRIEARDGSVQELPLTPVGVLHLGRSARVGDEKNELVYPDVASRLAATLRHDGVRWWIMRRVECTVPVQVGARALDRGEEAPLTHGTFVSVGGMSATFVDRRYVTPMVPAGVVDPATGLLGRAGVEQEIAAFLQRGKPGGLALLRLLPPAPGATETPATLASPGAAPAPPPSVRAAMAVHRAFPSMAVASTEGGLALLVPGAANDVAAATARAAEVAAQAADTEHVGGYWLLAGEGLDAGREVELALSAMDRLADPASARSGTVSALREQTPRTRLSTPAELQAASRDPKRATLLFAIEEQAALGGVGPHIVSALEKELCAVVGTHAGAGSLSAPLSPGVVAACISRKVDPAATGAAVQCDWHARPPVLDGKAELPRALSWEVLSGEDVVARAAALARECADPHGVLSALSGGLPYPIAGRVHAAIASSSAVERVKMLFDVLEGTWRFIATVLASAAFARREASAGVEAMIDLSRRFSTRDGYALGTWRELSRAAAKSFPDGSEPIGALARDVLGVKLAQNQTFDALSNLMQAERNAFAHGQYNEARAAGDLPAFEQMTRTLLRALRPLSAWTMVTVEKTEPDLYGDLQTVEFVDHTGPFNTGTRRRIGLNSPVRLANVAYLARWREGLVLPLWPMIQRVAHGDRFELFWMDHLPRTGTCQMSAAVGAEQIKAQLDARRLPPQMRAAIERGAGG
jgi:hypothetical protein